MGVIEEYRARRGARLIEKKRKRIDDFRERRNDRLTKRGIIPDKYRMDAPEEKNNKNQAEESGGSHGNTRLPFGLCKRYGIEIGADWTPRDAWDALKSKGVTADGAYAAKKEGADPGTPESPEPPKEPVKKIKTKTGAEYGDLSGRHRTWARRGDNPWELEGKLIEETKPESGYIRRWFSESFWTKTDMLRYLKEQGVEEFADPETGEMINPKEMDLPEPMFKRGSTGYSDVSIGLRRGKYAVVGTDFDGKKKTIREFPSIKDATDYLESYGADMSKVKVSASTKKREKERLSWKDSGKKEYITGDDGVEYGDLSIDDGYYGDFKLKASAEDGSLFEKSFDTRAELMEYLKDQGVESVKDGESKTNPMEYTVPPTKFTFKDKPYQDAGIKVDRWGDFKLYGIDLDGREVSVAHKASSETLGMFRERLKKDYGVTEGQLTIDEDTLQKMHETDIAEAETERRRKEFAEKAVDVGGRKFMDLHIEKDYDGDLRVHGYDQYGKKRSVSYWGDMYDMEQWAKDNNIDMESLITDDIREEYKKYREARKDFDTRATDYAGDKYVDMEIVTDGGYLKLKGTDVRGRTREIDVADSYSRLEKRMNKEGFSPIMFPMDEKAKEKKERAVRAKKALAQGGYYSLGYEDSAFKDIRVEEDSDIKNKWKIMGTDQDGKEQVIMSVDNWDDAIAKMKDFGVSDYVVKDKSGTEIGRPKWGMHKVMLMRKPEGGYLVFADSDKYGSHAIMYETPKEEEARKWIRDNGIPDGAVKSRGMNPNDDVPRVHTAKSLSGFDTHRAERAEKIKMLDEMDDATKVEAAQMLTDLFDKGDYRMRRKGHFEEIFDSHFKSLLETGTSGGSTSKDGRRETGVKTFGHARDIKASDGEKYGYLGVSDDSEAFGSGVAKWYGGTVYKFKKDKIKDRVTYTFGDTLDAGRPLAGYAGDKPTIEGLSGLDVWDSGKGELESILKDYRRYKNGQMSYSDLLDNISRACRDGYIETHYHGDLTLADVDSITFPLKDKSDGWGDTSDGIRSTFSRMTPEKRKKVLTYLRDNDVKLQYYDPSDRKIHDGYEYVEREFGK